MSTPAESQKLVLHNFYRSSSSARLRIALHFKQIPFDYVSVDIFNGEQHTERYARVNPSKSVPTVVVPPTEEGGQAVFITQSAAALEWLEEAYPDRPALLPSARTPEGLLQRAVVRSLVQIMVADTQPVASIRTVKRLKELGVDGTEWQHEWYSNGLRAYEAAMSKTAGKYSVGDSLSLADACLVPSVWNAEHLGIPLEEQFPTIAKVYAELSKVDAVQKAHWKAQVDTPEELRN